MRCRLSFLVMMQLSLVAVAAEAPATAPAEPSVEVAYLRVMQPMSPELRNLILGPQMGALWEC